MSSNIKLQFVINKKRRSMISCLECRRKKQKCDEIKPSCSRCITSHTSCEYKRVPRLKRNNFNVETKVLNLFAGDCGVAIDKEKIRSVDPCKVSNISQNLSSQKLDSLKPKTDEFRGSRRLEEVDNFKRIELLNQPSRIVLDEEEGFSRGDDAEYNDNLKTFKSTPLDLDLEFQALTILSVSDNMKDHFAKYNQCYPLLLSLAFSDKTVMFTFAGWILSIKNESTAAERFLQESAKLVESAEKNLLTSGISNEKLTGVVVSQTCHALLASSRGDYVSWRGMFEKIYKLFYLLDIDEAIDLFQDNPFLCWVLGWLFYQDTFRLGKLSKKEVFGPLFSKHTYVKLINVMSRHEINDLNYRLGCGPLTKCCATLCIKMGEVNTLYDLFKVKLDELNKYNQEQIGPTLANQDLSRNDLFEFLESEIYHKYHKMKLHFYSWFDKKVGILEEKISQTQPNLDYVGLTDIQKKQLGIFHHVLKSSIRVFLKMRFLNCSPTNFEIKLLYTEIIEGIRKLVTWELSNNLLLPFLIAGTTVYKTADRLMFKKTYEELRKHLKSENLTKVWNITQSIWKSSGRKDNYGNLADLINIIGSDVCVF